MQQGLAEDEAEGEGRRGKERTESLQTESSVLAIWLLLPADENRENSL